MRQLGIAGSPPGDRAVDADGLAHPAGPSRQHRDLMAKAHRFGEIMCDTNSG
jgi:hypothetical protein